MSREPGQQVQFAGDSRPTQGIVPPGRLLEETRRCFVWGDAGRGLLPGACVRHQDMCTKPRGVSRRDRSLRKGRLAMDGTQDDLVEKADV